MLLPGVLTGLALASLDSNPTAGGVIPPGGQWPRHGAPYFTKKNNACCNGTGEAASDDMFRVRIDVQAPNCCPAGSEGFGKPQNVVLGDRVGGGGQGTSSIPTTGGPVVFGNPVKRPPDTAPIPNQIVTRPDTVFSPDDTTIDANYRPGTERAELERYGNPRLYGSVDDDFADDRYIDQVATVSTGSGDGSTTPIVGIGAPNYRRLISQAGRSGHNAPVVAVQQGEGGPPIGEDFRLPPYHRGPVSPMAPNVQVGPPIEGYGF